MQKPKAAKENKKEEGKRSDRKRKLSQREQAIWDTLIDSKVQAADLVAKRGGRNEGMSEDCSATTAISLGGDEDNHPGISSEVSSILFRRSGPTYNTNTTTTATTTVLSPRDIVLPTGDLAEHLSFATAPAPSSTINTMATDDGVDLETPPEPSSSS